MAANLFLSSVKSFNSEEHRHKDNADYDNSAHFTTPNKNKRLIFHHCRSSAILVCLYLNFCPINQRRTKRDSGSNKSNNDNNADHDNTPNKVPLYRGVLYKGPIYTPCIYVKPCVYHLYIKAAGLYTYYIYLNPSID